MDSLEIKAAIRRAGRTVAAIARDLDVHESAVRAAVEGRGRAARIETAVAAVIGLHPSEIWPQWYGGTVAPAATPERLPALDLDLHAAIEQAYWNAAAARGDDPILPLAAKHLGRLYNRCAEQLTRSADAAAKFAVAVREIAYLVEMDHLPRFELAAAAPAPAGTTVKVKGRGNRVAGKNYIEK